MWARRTVRWIQTREWWTAGVYGFHMCLASASYTSYCSAYPSSACLWSGPSPTSSTTCACISSYTRLKERRLRLRTKARLGYWPTGNRWTTGSSSPLLESFSPSPLLYCISWPVSIQSMTGSTSSSTPFPCSPCLSPNFLSSTGSVSSELISTDEVLIFNARGCDLMTYSVEIKQGEI